MRVRKAESERSKTQRCNPTSMGCHERTYRNKISKGNLTTFHVTVEQTDLFISTDRDVKEHALQSVFVYRRQIEEYIKYRPVFLESLTPIERDHIAPPIIRDMLDASHTAGVGPMASVAGVIAQYVGTDLLAISETVIVENGGDIFITSPHTETHVGIFAGDSPLSYRMSLKIRSENTPLCVCTSSGTIGHSLSLGIADAVCVVSKSGALADAAATSLGNMVKGEGDIRNTLDVGSEIQGVLGIVIIVKDKLGAWGDVEFA